MNTLISAGAKVALDPYQYEAEYEGLETKYRKVDGKRAQIGSAIKDREHRSHQAHQVHQYLQAQPPLAYTPEAWSTLVAEARVSTHESITICFKDQIDATEWTASARDSRNS